MIYYVEQRRKTPVVVEAALHVSEETTQRSCAIRFVRRTVCLEIVYPNLRWLVSMVSQL